MNRIRFALFALFSPERLTLEIIRGFIEVVDTLSDEELKALVKQVN